MNSIPVPLQPRRIEKTVRKSLAVPLTEEEVKAKTDQMVSDMTELAKIEVEHKARKKEMSDETKDLKADIAKACKIVVARTETRLVEDAIQVYDLDAKRTWFEYRGQQFDNMAISEFELKTLVKPPLFPDHEDADKDSDEDADDDMPLSPLPSNISEIEEVRRSETKRTGKKDHVTG